MKKFNLLIAIFFIAMLPCFAEEVKDNEDVAAEQVIEMIENKVIFNLQKQPLNENSHQKIIMKKNWFVINNNINGKIKIQPVKANYEVE